MNMKNINNLNTLSLHFGFLPTFHDDEILFLVIDAEKQVLSVTINALNYGDKNCHVELKFSNLDKLSISGIYRQNVIRELNIVEEKDGRIQVYVDSSVGLLFQLRCNSVSAKIS